MFRNFIIHDTNIKFVKNCNVSELSAGSVLHINNLNDPQFWYTIFYIIYLKHLFTSFFSKYLFVYGRSDKNIVAIRTVGLMKNKILVFLQVELQSTILSSIIVFFQLLTFNSNNKFLFIIIYKYVMNRNDVIFSFSSLVYITVGGNIISLQSAGFIWYM